MPPTIGFALVETVGTAFALVAKRRSDNHVNRCALFELAHADGRAIFLAAATDSYDAVRALKRQDLQVPLPPTIPREVEHQPGMYVCLRGGDEVPGTW